MSLADISTEFTVETLDIIIKSIGGKRHESWEFAGGFKKGDSYLSEVFRLIIVGVREDGSKCTAKVVIKAIPKNLGRRKTFRSADFFRNEINFYTKIIPGFVDFQAARSVTDPFDAFPTCYAAHVDGENDYIVLEDLGQYGFQTAVRQQGLDIVHCRKIMQTLGRFHAMSFAIRDQDPMLFKRLTGAVEETYYADKFRKWYEPFFLDQIVVAADAVTREYPGSAIERKMHEFTGISCRLYDTMVRLTHSTNQYSVLGHGDCWTPNFLMTYEDGEGGHRVPKIVKVIDYQLSRYASPAIDLSFFFYSCTSQELREMHYDELLKVYHNNLSELLKDLGSDPTELFPFEALQVFFTIC